MISVYEWYDEFLGVYPSRWQAVGFEYSPRDGWRVGYSGFIYPMVKPYLQKFEDCNCLLVAACFKKKIRAGQFCKNPHTYIDFDNSYERKDK
jgi:hypothetical protein